MPEFGYQPKHIHLLDSKLTLDPQIAATIAEIQARIAARDWLDRLMNPRWELSMDFFQSLLMAPPQPGPFTLPAPSPAAPLVTPGAGPAVARPGEMKEVAEALYKVPAIQNLAQRAQEALMRDLNRLKAEWKGAPMPEKVTMISVGTLFAAGVITPVLANRPTRLLAFDAIKGKDIPLPLLPGWSFRVLDNGAGLKAPLGHPAVTGDVSVQAPGGTVNWSATVNVDVAAVVKALK